MKPAELSPELQQEADRLALLPDSTIDLIDIPEAPQEAWLYARRPCVAPTHGSAFGKTQDQQIEAIRAVGALKAFGLPVMVGLSKKSFLGRLTGAPPAKVTK